MADAAQLRFIETLQVGGVGIAPITVLLEFVEDENRDIDSLGNVPGRLLDFGIDADFISGAVLKVYDKL